MTKRPILSLLAILLLLELGGCAPQISAYATSFDARTVGTFITGLAIFAQFVLQVQTGRGLLHWIGVGVVALGGMVDVIPLWLWDGAREFTHRASHAARERIALVSHGDFVDD